MKRILLALAVLAVSCTGTDMLVTAGISEDLAAFRKENYREAEYSLSFCIPESVEEHIPAHETASLSMDKKKDIILDFSVPQQISLITANGKEIRPVVAENHIIIPRRHTRSGKNIIEIDFLAGEQSLNRRQEFMYTLLVPARAHTLFPCFDQPDLKAVYKLDLTVPEGWTAVSNTSVSNAEGQHVEFAPTEPLSTYLFAFTAGRFQSVSRQRGERTISLYHRETDPEKIAQCDEILDLVFSSLDYLEDYTALPYPFAKYDLIAIPDFQYGGMEHTGATLYNDRRIFLEKAATTDEKLSRASLIAHETAHMWFGDCVTMKWFNDVWTKEVFANWFASKMARPQFPGINHTLGDLKTLYAPAYSEDRTPGSSAIQRPLDNLSNAGLIYSNIIYDKAPVAMEKLAGKIGGDNFKAGIREYLQTYKYSNASWDDLIDILDRHADFDVNGWSRVWIKEKGMPVYRTETDGSRLTVTQTDPFGNGNIWPQDIRYRIETENGTTEHVFSFSGSEKETAVFDAPVKHVVPNTDGSAYGYFALSERDAENILKDWSSYTDTGRMSLLMTLYENVLRGRISTDRFVTWAASMIRTEPNPQIEGSLLSYANTAFSKGCSSNAEAEYAGTLHSLSKDTQTAAEQRLLCFRQLYTLTDAEDINSELYSIWEKEIPYKGMTLSESDYTAMAYQLMIRFPQKAEEIRSIQCGRITNPDRKEAFMSISQAASADKEERERFFKSFSDASSRRPESRALSALGLLNHRLRQQESLEYIRPALELLPEIQKTGDIFFPASWCRTLMGSHWSDEAAAEVIDYLESHKDLNPLLATKVLLVLPPEQD